MQIGCIEEQSLQALSNRSNYNFYEVWAMSLYKRKDRNGKVTGWRVVVRIKGYPTVCKEFERKQEADDWKIAPFSNGFVW